MNTEIQNVTTTDVQSSLVPPDVIESLVLNGDLSRMNGEQKVQFYTNICKSLGLNPLTQPFEIINLKGKLRMYAKKDATDQLRKIYGVSVTDLEKTQINDIYMVTAKGQDRTGRTDSAIGAVSITGLMGENLANAIMKAETKAKRRLTLSLCGLGMLDESEVEDISKMGVEEQKAKNQYHNIDVIDPADQTMINKFGPMITAIDDPRIPDSQFDPQTREQFKSDFIAEFNSGTMPVSKAEAIYNQLLSYFS